MKRRNLLVTVGAALASVGAVGTGAFTSVEAEREVKVGVADDSDAYLALRPTETGSDGESENGVFARSIPGDSGANELFLDFNEVTGEDSRGPGSNAEYAFDGVFAIRNDGTQTVYVDAEFNKADLDAIGFYVGDDRDRVLDGSDSALKLKSADEAFIGVTFDTTGIDVDFDEENPMNRIQDVEATISATEEKPADSATILDEDGSTVD